MQTSVIFLINLIDQLVWWPETLVWRGSQRTIRQTPLLAMNGVTHSNTQCPCNKPISDLEDKQQVCKLSQVINPELFKIYGGRRLSEFHSPCNWPKGVVEISKREA